MPSANPSACPIAVDDGFTLAQEFETKGGVPHRRVGGMDVSLVSAGDDDGDREPVTSPDVHRIFNYDDGSTGYLLTNGDWIGDGADGHGLRQDKSGKILDAGTRIPTPTSAPTIRRPRSRSRRGSACTGRRS